MLTPQMKAALARAYLVLFAAVQIATPSGPLRLIDGTGEVTFGGMTFLGLDPTYGVLAGVEGVTDGFGDEAPALRITINPPTMAAAGVLTDQTLQGAQVLIWIGVVNQQDGSVVADPMVIFAGEVDTGTMTIGKGTRSVAIQCVSIWERLFDDLQGVRLTNAYHQSVWPGELGLEYVTAVSRQLPWGADTMRPDVVRDVLVTPPPLGSVR